MDAALIFLLFAVGRIGFNAIHHSNVRSNVFELIFTSVFFAAALLWRVLVTSLYDGGVIAALYIGTALVSRWMTAAKNGQWIGIIDFVWISILGLACGGIVYARNFDVLQIGKIPQGMQPEFYAQFAQELEFLLGKAIDMILILGSILAVCMSILWSGEIWRKRDRESEEQYRSTTRAAIGMAFSYFIVLIATAIWVDIPLYANYTAVKDFLH